MKANKPSPKFTHWTFQGEEPDTSLYLRLVFEGRSISFSTSQLSGSPSYSDLPMRKYVQGSLLPLTDGYYCPISPSEKTFDSFIYEARTKTATIFQVTVRNVHSVKEGGIEWLRGLGVERFRYIVVTPPRLTLDFSFPNQWRGGVVPDISEKVCSCPWIALYLNCWVSLYYYFIIFYQLFC